MEIDQRNLKQAKELQNKSKEIIQVDQERLALIVQQYEVQSIKRKCKIAAVIEQVCLKRTNVFHFSLIP